MLTAVDLEGVTFAGAAEEEAACDGDGEGGGSEVGGDGGAGEVAIDGAAPGALGRLNGPSALLARTTGAALCFTPPLYPARLELDSESEGSVPTNW
jgi:hypothetical protein